MFIMDKQRLCKSLRWPMPEFTVSRSDLINCDFRNENLIGADLEWANLNGADLRGTILCGAKMNGFYLENVHFCTIYNTDQTIANMNYNGQV